jgi:hypothetical protein
MSFVQRLDVDWMTLRELREALVAGHKRQLPDGYQASPEKEAEAAALNIHLQPGETWVRPHSRGSPSQRQASVRWTPSIDIAAL